MRTVQGSSETMRHLSIILSNSKCAINGNYFQVLWALFSREWPDVRKLVSNMHWAIKAHPQERPRQRSLSQSQKLLLNTADIPLPSFHSLLWLVPSHKLVLFSCFPWQDQRLDPMKAPFAFLWPCQGGIGVVSMEWSRTGLVRCSPLNFLGHFREKLTVALLWDQKVSATKFILRALR